MLVVFGKRLYKLLEEEMRRKRGIAGKEGPIYPFHLLYRWCSIPNMSRAFPTIWSTRSSIFSGR
jgi:hypothetical protein